jgi:acyl-CoA thioester hydrolase
LRERGYPYRSLEEKNCFLPVVEIGCRYRAPARYDDLLEVETQLEEITNAKIRFSYKIKKMEENQIIATGFTIHACTDEKGAPTRVPSMIKEFVKDHDEV